MTVVIFPVLPRGHAEVDEHDAFLFMPVVLDRGWFGQAHLLGENTRELLQDKKCKNDCSFHVISSHN